MVTHDRDEAFALAGRIAVLDQGRIVELGDHEELAARDGLYAAQLRAGLTVA